jgi:hypothetical protein
MRLQILRTARRFSTCRAAASFLAVALGLEVSEFTQYCLTQSAKVCQCKQRYNNFDGCKPQLADARANFVANALAFSDRFLPLKNRLS